MHLILQACMIFPRTVNYFFQTYTQLKSLGQLHYPQVQVSEQISSYCSTITLPSRALPTLCRAVYVDFLLDWKLPFSLFHSLKILYQFMLFIQCKVVKVTNTKSKCSANYLLMSNINLTAHKKLDLVFINFFLNTTVKVSYANLIKPSCL